MNESEKHICMISDDNYVIPTCVAIQSLIETNINNVNYCVHIIASELSEETIELFKCLKNNKLEIDIIKVNASKTFKNYHKYDNNAVCVASISSLFKFMIADILPQLDKVLYLDGDIIIKSDISSIFNFDINDYYAAVVIDSGSIYYKHKYLKKVTNYFNSGVMLLNLNKLRIDNMGKKLCEEKINSRDSSLMDQNVFNIMFNNKIVLLPIKYNLLAVNLERANNKWKIEQINDIYGTNYKTKKELYNDAIIIHYSSKDKPWKNLDGAYSSDWISVYLKTPIDHSLVNFEENSNMYNVSVIISFYNEEKNINMVLDSIIKKQTLRNVEIICINNASTDNTLNMLELYKDKYTNIKVISTKSYKQNLGYDIGLKFTTGKYIYFMNIDDILMPNCLEMLYKNMEENKLDLLFFEGNSIYQKKEIYPSVYSGKDLYILLKENNDFQASIYLQMVRKDFLLENQIYFPEISMLKDEFYTYNTILSAKRVKCITNILCNHSDYKKTVLSRKEINSILNVMESLLKKLIKYRNDTCLYTIIFNDILFFSKRIDELYKELDEIDEQSLINSITDSQKNIFLMVFLLKNIYFNNDKNFYLLKLKNNRVEGLSKKDNANCIISLTSYPKRIKTVSDCIKSLLNQKNLPKKVILWLSKIDFPNMEKNLPLDLLKLTENNLFEIRWTDDDLGPHKKYYYVMQEFKDIPIIIVDDDVCYDKNLVKILMESYRRFPDCISCMRANLITFESNGDLKMYKSWIKGYKGLLNVPSYKLLPTGVGGVLYPPDCLSKEVFNKSAIKEKALYCDDLWLKFGAVKNNIKTVVPKKYTLYKEIPDTQVVGLYHFNIKKGNNDKCMMNIINYYDRRTFMPDFILDKIKKESKVKNIYYIFFLKNVCKKYLNYMYKIKYSLKNEGFIVTLEKIKQKFLKKLRNR